MIDMPEDGTIVRYTRNFCRVLGTVTPPQNGLVVAAADLPETVWVLWCTDMEPRPIRICNIELHPDMKRLGMPGMATKESLKADAAHYRKEHGLDV